MAQQGDTVSVFYNGYELGLPGADPEARLGYFDGATFVEVVAPVTMTELAVEPGPVNTQLWSAQFVIPSPAPAFDQWIAIVKANIAAVDRYFALPVQIDQNVGQRALAAFGGSDLSLAGPWVIQQLKEIRRVTNRLIIANQLVDQFVRDRITVQASPRLVQQGEDATFTFTLIDEEKRGLLNIEGATIQFVAEDQETQMSAWDVPCSIVDNEGVCEAILPAAQTANEGSFTGQVIVTLPDTTVKKSSTFTVVIGSSVATP